MSLNPGIVSTAPIPPEPNQIDAERSGVPASPTPPAPLGTALGVLSAVLLMATLPGDTWIRLIVWMLIGLVIYFAYGHQRVLVATATSSD